MLITISMLVSFSLHSLFPNDKIEFHDSRSGAERHEEIGAEKDGSKQGNQKGGDSFKTDLNNDDTYAWFQRMDDEEIREHQEHGMKTAKRHVYVSPHKRYALDDCSPHKTMMRNSCAQGIAHHDGKIDQVHGCRNGRRRSAHTNHGSA